MNEPDLSKLKDYEYPDIAQRFFSETKNHKLTIKHDDGVYRHLRMMDPKDSAYWYDVITTPGYLHFNGDGESFVFARLTDMFQFFRSGIHKDGSIHVNVDYWSEKLKSSRGKEKVYDEDRFEKEVRQRVDEAIEEGTFTEEEVKEFRQEIQDWIFDDWGTAEEGAAFKIVADFEFKYGPKDKWGSPTKTWQFYEPHEWFGATKDYDWWLVWALYAIPYAIQAYDREKGALSGNLVETGTELVDAGRDLAGFGRVL